jgi:hypothetical protein
VGVVDLGAATQRLAIGDLRSTDVDGDAELAADAINQPFEMLLAQPPDDCLPGFSIARDIEAVLILCR